MEMNIDKYNEAISCLRETAKEGRKSQNVDIRLMLANVHCCEGLVKELIGEEGESVYTNALQSVAGSLSGNAAVLNRKIRQLHLSVDKGTPRTVGTLSLAHTTGLSTDGSRAPARYPMTPARGPPIVPKPVTPVNGASPWMNDDDSGAAPSSTNASPPASPAQSGRSDIIASTISRPTDLSFAKVVGLETAKQALTEAVITPLLFPHLFSGGRHSWRRILLYGPPGTGKSRLAQAVSSEVKATFYSVSSTDLMSSWVGETEKLIKELFQHARSQPGQSVIFIDEIDSLCRKRNSREDEGTRRIKTELLIQMDGRERQGQDKIFLLCATNCPWDLDSAFLRRFHKRIYIPIPDSPARVQLLRLHCQDSHVALTESDWQELARLTAGYSGSDLATLVMAATMMPISELQTAIHWLCQADKTWRPCGNNVPGALHIKARDLPTNKIRPRPVQIQDFLHSLASHRPTVGEGELKRMEDFTQNCGQMG